MAREQAFSSVPSLKIFSGINVGLLRSLGELKRAPGAQRIVLESEGTPVTLA